MNDCFGNHCHGFAVGVVEAVLDEVSEAKVEVDIGLGIDTSRDELEAHFDRFVVWVALEDFLQERMLAEFLNGELNTSNEFAVIHLKLSDAMASKDL